MSGTVAKPFLKWAGGKGQLTAKFNPLYPTELKDGKIDLYIEPFVGGGAALFDILQKYNIKNAIINDINKELINCYRCIKHDVAQLIKHLEKLQENYINTEPAMRNDFFMAIRKRYNEIKLNGKFDFEKAADFIFLNKTCFNGLYRVNSRGEFNVPFGKYKNPNICDKNNLILISQLLQRVEIYHGNYAQCLQWAAGNDTFIYLDPPYRPLTSSASFVGYATGGFDDNNQKELAQFVTTISEKGAKIMLTNSDPKNTNINDNFFDDLYNQFNIQRIQAKRMINCQADKRGNITEIVIRNYTNGDTND